MIDRRFLRSVTFRPDAEPCPGYPFDIPAVRAIDRIDFHSSVTFLVGENGSGKSTLVEAVAVSMGMNAEGGSQNFNFTTRASHSPLADMLRPVRGAQRPKSRFFLRAESYFNLATNIEDLDREPGGGPPIIANFGGRSLHEQSHGESFMALMLHRFGANGFYVLDEPESALSPARQLAMLVRMHQLVAAGSQFVVATHSPMLMAYPDARIYRLDADGVAQCALRETDNFRITRDFLHDPEARVARLLAEF